MKKKSIVKSLIIGILIAAFIIFAAYLALVNSFENIMDVKDKQLRLAVNSYSGTQKTTCMQTLENTERIVSILSKYKYFRVWDIDGTKPYTYGINIMMTFDNNTEVSTMQINSFGQITVGSKGRNKYYIALGNGKLFDELYKIVETSEDKIGVVKDLTTAFEKKGYQVEYTQATKNILDGTRSLIKFSNGSVQLFTYETAKSAAEDISRLSDEGLSYENKNGLGSYISWVGTPHFYIKDNVIVLYVGPSNNILAILSSICGAQVKGG